MENEDIHAMTQSHCKNKKLTENQDYENPTSRSHPNP